MKTRSNIYPVYLFYGPEDYLIEEEIQKLLNHTLSRKERGMNLHLFRGEEHGSQEIVQTAQTLPMFARYRFVLVSEADDMEEDKVEALMEYIRKSSPTTCFVLRGQTIGPWKVYRKEIDKRGRVIEFPRLKGRALLSWMKNRMAEKGKKLSEEAADYLIEVVGDHLHDLDNSLETAFLSGGEKETIELLDVERTASEAKSSTVFDLTDAIGHQNLEKALGILETAVESRAISFKKDEASKRGNDPVPLLLSMMAKQYWSMLMIKLMISHHRGVEDLAKELGTSTWNIKKLMEQGKKFSEASLQEGIRKCHQTDLAIKRSRGPKDLLMEKLVIDLCRPSHSTSPPIKKVVTNRNQER